jgi:DNA-binding transcriptional ArsR family regulator
MWRNMKPSLRDFQTVNRALSDPNRLRALLALRRGELCVCQIVELLELAASTVSRHLSVLERAGLVERRKEGRWVYYRRPVPTGTGLEGEVLRWADETLARDPAIRADAARLREIVKIPVEELCRGSDA